MPNLIYENSEATIWFVPATATQAEDAAFEINSLATVTGRQSAQYDFGVAARSRRFEWRAFIQFTANPVVGEVIDIYLKTAGSSASATIHPQNDDGTGEGALSATNKLKNLQYLGSIVVDEAISGIEMVQSGYVEINARAVQVVFYNATATQFAAGVNDSGFMLTPVPDEVQ